MKKILVIQTASIGDVILVTPVLEALHEQYPQASISLLVKKGMGSLFERHPFLHRVYSWDKQNDKYKNLINLIRQIRKESFDLVINAQRFFSSGLISVLSGGKIVSGFKKNPLSFFFTHRVSHQIGKDNLHEAERNLRLIPGNVSLKERARVRLYPTAFDYEVVSSYHEYPCICISPASLWFTKQYPTEKWVELVRSLPGEYTIYLLGSHTDQSLNQSIIQQSGKTKVFNLAGQLSLLQSAALMEKAVISFVNDSAPLHLCSARDAAVVAVFCSTVTGFGFGPYGSRGRVVETKEKLTCRPCGLHGHRSCPEKHFRCAYSIQNEQLLQTLSP